MAPHPSSFTYSARALSRERHVFHACRYEIRIQPPVGSPRTVWHRYSDFVSLEERLVAGGELRRLINGELPILPPKGPFRSHGAWGDERQQGLEDFLRAVLVAFGGKAELPEDLANFLDVPDAEVSELKRLAATPAWRLSAADAAKKVQRAFRGRGSSQQEPDAPGVHSATRDSVEACSGGLTVFVNRATDLVGKTFLGNRFYCTCHVVSDESVSPSLTFQTKSAATLDPVWHETFDIEYDNVSPLEFRVYDDAGFFGARWVDTLTLAADDVRNGFDGPSPLPTRTDAKLYVRVTRKVAVA